MALRVFPGLGEIPLVWATDSDMSKPFFTLAGRGLRGALGPRVSRATGVYLVSE